MQLIEKVRARRSLSGSKSRWVPCGTRDLAVKPGRRLDILLSLLEHPRNMRLREQRRDTEHTGAATTNVVWLTLIRRTMTRNVAVFIPMSHCSGTVGLTRMRLSGRKEQCHCQHGHDHSQPALKPQGSAHCRLLLSMMPPLASSNHVRLTSVDLTSDHTMHLPTMVRSRAVFPAHMLDAYSAVRGSRLELHQAFTTGREQAGECRAACRTAHATGRDIRQQAR